MRMEGYNMGASRRMQSPEERQREMQNAKEMTRKRIQALDLKSVSSDRTKEISQKRVRTVEEKIQYGKLTAKLEKVNSEIIAILKSEGKIDKEARARKKDLELEKKDLEKEIGKLTHLSIWRDDGGAAA